MIIDAHNTIIPWDEEACQSIFPPKILESFRVCSYENVLKEMDRLQIDRLITWNVAQNPGVARLCNEWTARVRDRNPSRLIGFCCVHPAALDEAMRELERCVVELGLSGLKLHPQVQRTAMNDPNLIRLIERAKELDLPVVLHVNPPIYEEYQSMDIEDFSPVNQVQLVRDDFANGMRSEFSDQSHLKAVIKVYESAKLMSAHMGGIFLKEAIGSKISFQTTGASGKIIEWACKFIGADRVIFGTDFPFFRMERELEKVKTLSITDEEKEKVLSGNILNILKKGAR